MGKIHSAALDSKPKDALIPQAPPEAQAENSQIRYQSLRPGRAVPEVTWEWYFMGNNTQTP